MARFPDKEADIFLLGQHMAVGLLSNVAIFPTPPVAAADFQILFDAAMEARNAATAAQAAAQTAIQAKNAALATLVEAMKTDLHYAEDTVHGDNAKLMLLGWGGLSASVPLAVPGQPRTLEAPKQGEGWLFLDWKEPLEGGAVAAYKIQRRLRPDGPWNDIATAIESEMMLVGQERAKEWEYRVIAVNKAGESEPGNSIMAVL